MKTRSGLVVLASALSLVGSLAIASSVGAFSLATVPSTQSPVSHYATERSQVAPVSRKSLVESDDLVVAVDDFTYTGVIKASATNPYAPPPRRPPTKKTTPPSKKTK
ncbi:MAG: hypothetical protein KJS91_14150 [Planctomycetes bacterium]|nr:hypothetical protein [Planctomycetota bacterium]